MKVLQAVVLAGAVGLGGCAEFFMTPCERSGGDPEICANQRAGALMQLQGLQAQQLQNQRMQQQNYLDTQQRFYQAAQPTYRPTSTTCMRAGIMVNCTSY